MSTVVRRLAWSAAIVLIGVYGIIALRGPQGVPALLEKQREIRQLEVENANLERDNRYKRERIERLRNNPSEQELEIRKQLKLLRPDETEFILPEASRAKQ